MRLSLCMIANEPIDRCAASVCQSVDEVIVVRTGTWGAPEGATVIACPAELLTIDKESGATYLHDFAAARNLSFAHATGDYVMWLDSDDTVEGANKLRGAVEVMARDELTVVALDYIYGTDERGNSTCSLRRERIFKRGIGTWKYPVHEVYVTSPDLKTGYCPDVVVRHHKQEKPPCPVKNRNVKILQGVKDPDARELFYLGNETRFYDPPAAVGYFERYLHVGLWDAERAQARVLLGQLHEVNGNLEDAFRCYASATADYPGNPDGWFGLARICYFREQWGRCCEHTEAGLVRLKLPTHTIFDPLARQFTPHIYYNFALNKLGRVQEALASCNAGLALANNDHMRQNKALYEAFLVKEAA